MSDDVGANTGMKSPRSPWRWVAAVGAAAVVLVAIVASFGLLGSDDTGEDPAAAPPSPTATVTETAPVPSGSASAGGPAATELTVVADAARCIPPTSKWLSQNAALAFEGTVESMTKDEAVLRVKTWMYADGFGGTDTVRVVLPAPSTIPMPEFEKGKDYLVAAKGDAKVIGCGYSDVKSAKLQKLYTAAFK
ncbi:hypothetical protein [Nocardioides albus]|uniref:Uncharacterized protein n=1 Tax=Nocardioides albus TaxID=1841 RepID=A0A7W5A8P4_9ACTN|nr:hypothetical protein [Nocardioides albus]MBB3091612.1 hypothetical protein [Nocardioides albus]